MQNGVKRASVEECVVAVCWSEQGVPHATNHACNPLPTREPVKQRPWRVYAAVNHGQGADCTERGERLTLGPPEVIISVRHVELWL